MIHGPQSFFFQTVIRFLFFVINLLAVYLLVRGHNHPGGGFIAGLATAISIVLLGLVTGLRELHGVMRIDPVRIAATGVATAFLTGLGPLLFNRPFLEQFTLHYENLPLLGSVHVGTPLLFDLGVYLVVVGVTCKILLVLSQSSQQLRVLIEDEKAFYSLPMEEPIEEELVRDDERWNRGIPEPRLALPAPETPLTPPTDPR